MFGILATGFYSRFVPRRLGVKPIGAFDTALIAAGTALIVRGERLPLGIALMIAGAYRSWKDVKDRRDSQPCAPS